MNDSRNPRYCGAYCPDIEKHDGGLRWAAGVSNFQVTRADRHRPELCEGRGWTYNHAADLTYFHGRFYLQYLGNPLDEHLAPGASFLSWSEDGVSWSLPVESFPPYRIPEGIVTDADGVEHIVAADTYAVMHQRMAFYQSGGRLLVLGFYGNPDSVAQSPFNRNGIGRAVREIFADGSLSPIYFISCNKWAGWTEERLNYPMYTASPDAGFVAACEALLADPPAVQQWLDEHGNDDERIPIKGYGRLSAFCSYHIDEQRMVGLFKWGRVCHSDDNGRTWSEPVYEPSLVMPGSKIWGQRTRDGRFALVWTPTHSQNARWPLAVATSDDGLCFNDMLCVHGEVPMARYRGKCKDCGPQYMRGISEGQQTPGDNCMWVAYSVNKEDIWVSRVPLPVSGTVDSDADEDFAPRAASAIVEGWNVYAPRRCPVCVRSYGGRGFLELRDSDSADYARAAKLFRARGQIVLRTRVQVKRADAGGTLWLELCDGRGQIAAGLCFNEDGAISVLADLELKRLERCRVGKWYEIELRADCAVQRFTLTLNGCDCGMFRFSYPVWEIERAVFRTGRRRTAPVMSAQLYDGQAFTDDVTPEQDAERHEIIALVDYLKTGETPAFDNPQSL